MYAYNWECMLTVNIKPSIFWSIGRTKVTVERITVTKVAITE